MSSFMKLSIRWRLTWFGTAIVAITLAIGWTARTTWNQAALLSQSIRRGQVLTFEIADRFQATVLVLNQSLRDFQTSHSPAAWQEFDRESTTLDHWIDDQLKALTYHPEEHAILENINEKFDVYREGAHGLTNQSNLATAPERQGLLLEQAETRSRELFNLGNQLAKAHRTLVDALIGNMQQSLRFLQELIFGLLLVLLALGAWVAVVVYRDMIAPLRVTLVETRALVERQEKLASLGVLAAGVAHEIRNPLTAIKARLFTQQKRLSPGSPEAEDAAVINGEINRLERIVRDFLQFARPAEPKLVRVAADAPLREVRELMASQLEKNGIVLKLDTLTSAEIEVDLHQIKQVLINLVHNAAESIERNGTITLRAHLATRRLRDLLVPVVILEVEDTGKGISSEVQKRLFDPFFSTKDSGTGLGLSIAARIVEKHGGILEFQTMVNHGTVFGIVLPQRIA
jgi:signal transduction histidine kinase